MVDEEPDGEVPRPSKEIKMKEPPKYKGQDSQEEFMTWLIQVLRFLQFYNYCGAILDKKRVLFLSSVLEGDALEHFNYEMYSPYRERRLTFEEAVASLFRRFVHRATARNAAQEFENAVYKGSISEFYNRLSKLSS